MKPLKITFRLQTPMVVPERALHFDALVGAAIYKIAERAGADDPLAASEDLPLGRLVGPDGRWCWQASQLQLIRNGGVFWQHYVRRFALSQWADDRARGAWEGRKEAIPIGSGPQKAYALVQPLAWVSSATAWCIGDAEALGSLLRSEIFALGRNTRMGWGRIREITIEDAPQGEVDWWRRRTIPSSCPTERLPGHFAAMATMRPPYWERGARQEVYEFAEGSAA